MVTNLAINDELLTSAFSMSGLKTKTEKVNLASEELIAKRAREDVIALFNSVEYDKDYDYKELRREKR